MDKEEVKIETPVNDVKVTTEEKEKFFKSFLSDKPYTETVSLFNNKFVVVFKTLSVDENDSIFKQITLDQAKGVASNNDGYFIKITQYRLGLSIESIGGVPFMAEVTSLTVPEDTVTGKTFIAERAKEFGKWQSFKLAGLLSAFRDFETKVLRLTDCLNDPSFWKAAA